MSRAVSGGPWAPLDVPVLIYLFRNWTTHAAMMEGAFGSIVRFRRYVDVMTQGLASIHCGFSKALLKSPVISPARRLDAARPRLNGLFCCCSFNERAGV